MISTKKFKDVIACLQWHIHNAPPDTPAELDNLKLTLKGLVELSDNYYGYRENSKHSEAFLLEIEDFINKFNAHIVAEREELIDTSFSLLEALSVVMKESSIAYGKISPTEEEIINHFQTSENWTPQGKTLVEEIFYQTLTRSEENP